MNERGLVSLLRAAGRALVTVGGGRLRSGGNRGCNSALTSDTLTGTTASAIAPIALASGGGLSLIRRSCLRARRLRALRCRRTATLGTLLTCLLTALLTVLPDSCRRTLAATATAADPVLQAVSGPSLEDVGVHGRCGTARQGHSATAGSSRRVGDGNPDLGHPDGVVGRAHSRLASRGRAEDEVRDVVGAVEA